MPSLEGVDAEAVDHLQFTLRSPVLQAAIWAFRSPQF